MEKTRAFDAILKHSTERVLLVGWDAADWKIILPLVEQGHMPHLQALMNRGVYGDLLTLQPVLSPMLWNSIATGHRPDVHGVHGFTEVDEVTNTVRSVGSTSRTCKALWNIVTQCGGRAHVANWYASHPSEPIKGICVSDQLRHSDNEHPTDQSVHPSALLSEFADLCLGADEIDEQTIQLFVSRFGEVDQDRDNRLAVLAKLLAESFSVHNFATRLVADDPWNLAAIYYPGIDHFCHAFINYHPPRPDNVSTRDFELYKDVVAGAYRLHDLFLGRLIQLAGPDTTVMLVSDHGFHSDGLRPTLIPKDPVGPVVQHREHGILVAAGKNLKSNQRVYGAGLLDITPTILTALGLPVGGDMPGRVLAESFTQQPTIEHIESWEQIDGDSGQHPKGFVAPSRDYGVMLEQFAALGYIDREQMDCTAGTDICRRENKWHLSQSLLYSGQVEKAADLLLKLCHDWPQRRWYAIELVEALRKLGHTTAARQLIEAIVAHHADTDQSRYLLGIAYLEEKRYRKSVELLGSITQAFAGNPEFHIALGRAFLRLRKPMNANKHFERATQINPHSVAAWIGLARCALRKRQWNSAQQHALKAISLDFSRPFAHVALGLARFRVGNREGSQLALSTAARLAPGWRFPHRLLAQMGMPLERQLAKDDKKTEYRLASRYLNDRRSEALSQLIELYIKTSPSDPNETPKPPREAFQRLRMTVVSGLPRSGTSLMMQILKAGGAEVLTDETREADLDNPKGYLEWESIKDLPRHPELLCQAKDKAIKIVSPMIAYLPVWHRYDMIFLDRDIEEVFASQSKMRQRNGTAAEQDIRQVLQAMEAHRTATLDLLKRSPNVRLLIVSYQELIINPDEWLRKIADFLDDQFELDIAKMATAIDPALYRNRSQNLNNPITTS